MAELTRRGFLKVTTATAAVVAVPSIVAPWPSHAAMPVWNHDPASAIGPSHWADIGFPTCGQGMAQSPVNIASRGIVGYHGSPLLLRYRPSELGVENTGHVVEVPIPTGVHDALQINGDRYELVQYHFHAPSEHAINGRRADVEAHLVHMNAAGATVVVGVLFRVGHKPNRLLDSILLSAPATAGEEVHAGEGSPAELFHHIAGVRATPEGRVQVNSFYAYDGSLTTPGCTQDVRWFLVADPGNVSAAAVRRFTR